MLEVYKNDYAYFLYREGFGLVSVSRSNLTIKLMGLGDWYLPTKYILQKHGKVLYAGKMAIGSIDEEKTDLINQLIKNW